MTKRQLFLIAGTLMLAACGTGTGICQTAGYSANENHNRDQIDLVECTDGQAPLPAAPPTPRVDSITP
jgi:hypothetical protein